MNEAGTPLSLSLSSRHLPLLMPAHLFSTVVHIETTCHQRYQRIAPLVDAPASLCITYIVHWDKLSSALPSYSSPCWCPSLHVLHTLYIDKFSPALPSYSCILYIYVAHWDKLSSALPTSPLVDARASFIHGIHTVTVVCTLNWGQLSPPTCCCTHIVHIAHWDKLSMLIPAHLFSMALFMYWDKLTSALLIVFPSAPQISHWWCNWQWGSNKHTGPPTGNCNFSSSVRPPINSSFKVRSPINLGTT